MELPKSCWRNNFTSLHPSNTTAADFIWFGCCSVAPAEIHLPLHISSLPIVAFWLFDYFLALLFQKCQCSWAKWGHKCLPWSAEGILGVRCAVWVAISGSAVEKGDGSYLIYLTYSIRLPHSASLLCPPLPLPQCPGWNDSFSALKSLKLQLPIKCYSDIFPHFSWAVTTLVYDFKDSGRNNLHLFFKNYFYFILKCWVKQLDVIIEGWWIWSSSVLIIPVM